jgi:putative ABC transport system permease protein
MESLLQDLRVAGRSFRRRPAFTAGALLILALGIGATTAIFSVVQAVILRPLPYLQPDRVTILQTHWLKTDAPGPVSMPDFRDIHDRSRSFEALAYYRDIEMSVAVGGSGDYATVVRATPEFFRAVGLTTQLGRVLNDEEHRDGRPAAVVSDAFWRQQLGRTADVVGSTLALAQRSYTVVGVLAPGQRFPDRADVYVPMAVLPQDDNRAGHRFLVVGRLEREVTVAQAQADLTSIARDLERVYPRTNEAKSFSLVPVTEALVGRVRPTLYALLAAVGFLLLIACANVANLLLARATERKREMAMRVAVGAARSRLVRQLLTESAMLGLAAGIAGVVVARVALSALIALAPEELPRLADIAVDGEALAFTVVLSFVASLLFGIVPAVRTSRVSLVSAMASGSKGAGGPNSWTQPAFVVGQIACAVVLVTGALLMGGTFASLAAVDLGYSTEQIVTLRTTLPVVGREGAERSAAFYRQLLSDIRAMPGVVAAGATMAPPTIMASSSGYTVEGRPPAGINGPIAVMSVVSPGYFSALRIPVLRGRDFEPRDAEGAPFVTVISASLAREAFPDDDPIGRRIKVGFDSDEFMTIVGIVGDVRTGGPEQQPQREVYMPHEQHRLNAMTVAVRTTADPDVLGAAVTRLIKERDPGVAVRVRTMDDVVSRTMAVPRFRSYVVMVFAVTALLLAAAGIYGVMAYNVSQRTGEIGLRLALGATPAGVAALFVRQSAAVTAIGLVIGAGLSLMLGRLVAGLLFGVTAHDPRVLGGAISVIGVMSLLACVGPIAVALRVAPVSALRQD